MKRLHQHIRPVAISAIVLLQLSLAQAGDWPRFRGELGSGKSPETVLPLTWSATENMVWRTRLPGPGASSPITYGDRIYLTCYTGYGVDEFEPGDIAQLRLHVLCLDRASGRIIWDRSHEASPHERKFEGQVTNHGYATGTPACDGEAVYAFFGVSGLVAYDLAGNLLWKADVGERTAGFGTAASPIVHGNLVFINASVEAQALIAFDKRSGQEQWRVEDINAAWNTPVVIQGLGGRDELLIGRKDFYHAFDPQTGTQLWQCGGIDDYVCPSVVVEDNIMYGIGGRTRMGVAIRLGGEGDVTESHRIWAEKSGANVTSPVYHEGYLYFLDDRGLFWCVDAATGEPQYKARTPAQGRVYPSVVLAGDRIYAVMRDHGTLVIKASPEEFELLAHNEIEGDESVFNASPAIDDGQLLLRSNEYLYCIGE